MTTETPENMRARRRLATRVVILAICAAFYGCATPQAPQQIACPDLTGRYENQSSPAGHKLARYFFGVDDRGEEIELIAQGPSTIVASTATRKAVLAADRDFVCTAGGIRLTRTDVRNIRLPPLLVEKEIFHYVFTKASDGALRMTEHVESHGTSFGIPMGTGEMQQRSEVRWRAVTSH